MTNPMIEFSPTWQTVAPLLVAVLENGTEEAKTQAKRELQRMAQMADMYVASQRAPNVNEAVRQTAEMVERETTPFPKLPTYSGNKFEPMPQHQWAWIEVRQAGRVWKGYKLLTEMGLLSETQRTKDGGYRLAMIMPPTMATDKATELLANAVGEGYTSEVGSSSVKPEGEKVSFKSNGAMK